MPEHKIVPPKLLPYYQELKALFLEKVAHDDAHHFGWKEDGRPYYWKWVSTQRLASKLGVSCAAARYNLTKLVLLGIVKANRNPNYIQWACVHVEGFEQMKYKDYLWRKI
jgi:hypothetical protein